MKAGRFTVQVGEPPHQTVHEVELVPPDVVRVDGVEHRVVPAANGSWRVLGQEGAHRVFVSRGETQAGYASTRGVAAPVEVKTAQAAALARALGGRTAGPVTVKAPMPGRVVKVLVKPGDAVEAGQSLIILEAMKMENEVLSPGEGQVRTVSVSVGQAVETGHVLAEIDDGHERAS